MGGIDDVRSVPRTEARKVLGYAQDLIAGARWALSEEHWQVAGRNAIDAGMAAADAAVIATEGVRSASKDHGAVVQLLDTHVRDFTAVQRRHLTGLLKKRNAIEYEHRVVTHVEAQQLIDHARRFAGWAEGVVARELA
jgi:hypothetical protein